MEELLTEEEKKAHRKRKEELTDIRTVLASSSGRNFLWRLLDKCGVFESTFTNDSLKMSYLSGQQDIGHFIMSEIVETDDRLLFKMMKENKMKHEMEAK